MCYMQLYLSLYLQLVPLPTLIQSEIIPVVRLLSPNTIPAEQDQVSSSEDQLWALTFYPLLTI